MKKESKNLGIAKSCPDCRKTLIKSANLIGQGSIRVKCPHCSAVILIEIGQKPFITTTKIKVGIIILILAGVYQIATLTGLKNSFMAMITENDIQVTK